MIPTVLLVMQDPFFSRSLSEKLLQFKTSVLTAGNILEALAACATHPVDVVLLDIRPTGTNPLQILSGVKRSHPDTEVILVNCHDNITAAMQGMQEGAFDEIMVPFDIGSLKKKIREALKWKKKHARSEKKRTFFDAFGNAMMAATFAQAGEFDTAKEISSSDGLQKKKP